MPGSRVVFTSRGTLVEHWGGTAVATWSESWGRADFALLRHFARDGALLGRAGRVRDFPGKVLPAALNRGLLAVARDTIWFARPADARVFAVSLDSLNDPSAATLTPVLAPALFYRMRSPYEVHRSDGGTPGGVGLEYHLKGFAVAAGGRYFVWGQVLSWPDPDAPGVLPRPQTVLVVYDRETRTPAVLDVGPEVLDLQVVGDLAYVIQFDAVNKRRFVGVYRLPLELPPAFQRCG